MLTDVLISRPPSTAIKVSAADERDIVDALKARALNSTPLSKPIPRVEKNEAEASLDDLFKRLTSTPPSAYPTPKSMDEEASNSRDKNIFTSEAKVLPDTPTKILEPVKSSELAKVDEPSQRDLEREYLQKARESLESLPAKEGAPVQLVKAVGGKLHRPIPLDTDVISPTNAEDLKIEYVANIVAYLNGLSKNEPKPIQADSIKKTLEQNGGDFLGLCAHLAKEKAIAIDNLDDVVGLCKAIMEVHPAEKQISHDPMDKMSSWPSQEKRDNSKLIHSNSSRLSQTLGSLSNSCGQLTQTSLWLSNSSYQGHRSPYELQPAPISSLGRKARIASSARVRQRLCDDQVHDCRGVSKIF